MSNHAMSAPIDVLAVLDRQITHTRQFGGSPSVQTLEEARAAIAELIEAAREVGAIECGAHVARLNIALRAVGGEAP